MRVWNDELAAGLVHRKALASAFGRIPARDPQAPDSSRHLIGFGIHPGTQVDAIDGRQSIAMFHAQQNPAFEGSLQIFAALLQRVAVAQQPRQTAMSPQNRPFSMIT